MHRLCNLHVEFWGSPPPQLSGPVAWRRPLPYMGPVILSEQEHCSKPLGHLLTPWGADGRALTYHVLGCLGFPGDRGASAEGRLNGVSSG